MADATEVVTEAAPDAKEAVQDVLDSRREFVIEQEEGELKSYFIAAPGGEDIRKADWQYSKVYNQAIIDGFLTAAQMTELLTEKGIISDDYTQRVEDVRIGLGAELFKLETLMESSTEEEREAVAMGVARYRDELFQLNQRVNGPMANTCENLAEDARTEFLTSRIIELKDQTKLWKDFEAFRTEDNAALAIKSRFEVMLWMQGLESNFLENTPEQAVLRKIAQSRLQEAVKIAADETAPDQVEDLELPEEKPVEEPKAEAKPKPKKKGRPKGSKNKKKTVAPKAEEPTPEEPKKDE